MMPASTHAVAASQNSRVPINMTSPENPSTSKNFHAESLSGLDQERFQPSRLIKWLCNPDIDLDRAEACARAVANFHGSHLSSALPGSVSGIDGLVLGRFREVRMHVLLPGEDRLGRLIEQGDLRYIRQSFLRELERPFGTVPIMHLDWHTVNEGVENEGVDKFVNLLTQRDLQESAVFFGLLPPMPAPESDPLLTTGQVAQRLGVSTEWARNLADSGVLRHERERLIGSNYPRRLIRASEVDRYIAERGA